MRVKIFPSCACGNLPAPPSKSMAHRLLIASAMASGESFIDNLSTCDDVKATVGCLEALGVSFTEHSNGYKIQGRNFLESAPGSELFCNESGSTLRMLIPAATLSGKEALFTAKAGLLRRPMDVYEKIYTERGLFFEKNEHGYKVIGSLPSGEYIIPGNVSSQFISGLIFALAARAERSVLKITPPFESRSYVDMTIDAVKSFSVNAYFMDELTVVIDGGGYVPQSLSVEGDYSGAAFTDAFNYIGGDVAVSGLSVTSRQGDRIYKDYFKLLKDGRPTLDISNCPDLAPILFALASYLNGADFIGTARLKIKESDRAAAMAEELSKIGGRVIIGENTVTIEKASLTYPTAPIDSHKDHRIVMAMAILLTLTGGEILGAEAVAKSYPDFFEHLKKININLEIYDEA